MTASAPGEPAPATGAPADGPPVVDQSGQEFGLFRFTIEGRRAPALFVGGWLAAIIGLGLAAIGLIASPSLPAAVLLLTGLGVLTVGLVLLGGSQSVERQAVARPYGGPSPVLLLATAVSATLLLAALVGLALEAAGVSLAAAERPLGDLVSVVVQALVFLGVVRFMVVAPGALSWADMGFRRGRRAVLSGLAAGAALALPVIVLTGIVAGIVVSLVGETPPSPLPATGSGVGLAVHLLAGAVIAPVAEETLFRGASLTAWRRSVGPTMAIARAAILFAAAHVLSIGGDSFGQAAGLALVATAARLPVAIVLGWLYVRTETIWAPIGLHAAFNAILLVVGELGTGG